MDQDIAKGNDAAVVGNAGGGVRVVLLKAAQGFTDDLKVALQGLAQQPVLLKLHQHHTVGCCFDKVRRVANIFKQLGRARMHRRFGVNG